MKFAKFANHAYFYNRVKLEVKKGRKLKKKPQLSDENFNSPNNYIKSTYF